MEKFVLNLTYFTCSKRKIQNLNFCVNYHKMNMLESDINIM